MNRVDRSAGRATIVKQELADDVDALQRAKRLLEAAIEPAHEQMIIGNYVRLERVEKGGGGTGEVWVARQLDTDDLVALKLARPELMPDVEVVFRQERRNGGQLQHEHILSPHDGGTHAGRPYVVMPLMSGTLAPIAAPSTTLQRKPSSSC